MKILAPGVWPIPKPEGAPPEVLPWAGIYRCTRCGARWELGPEDRAPGSSELFPGIPHPEDISYAVRCPTCNLTRHRYTEAATQRQKIEAQKEVLAKNAKKQRIEDTIFSSIVIVLLVAGIIGVALWR